MKNRPFETLFGYVKRILHRQKKTKTEICDNNTFKKININNIIIKNSSRIPKNIYYFYVDDNCPSTLNYSIKSIKNIMPEYKIDVIGFNYDDFLKDDITCSIISKRNLQKTEHFTQQQIWEILYDYKRLFMFKHGGICCSVGLYAIKSFNPLLIQNSFVSMSIKNGEYKEDDCLYGTIKECKNSFTRIYPPINYDMKEYETLKFTFRNGNLKNIVVNNDLMQAYAYNFI